MENIRIFARATKFVKLIDKAEFVRKTKGLYPKKYNEKTKKWIIDRYSKDEAEEIWINI